MLAIDCLRNSHEENLNGEKMNVDKYIILNKDTQQKTILNRAHSLISEREEILIIRQTGFLSSGSVGFGPSTSKWRA